MKKSMIIAALMCCIVSMSAQQTQNEPEALKSMKAKIQQVERLNRHENNFTVKLDSVTGDGIRFLYEYDDRLNCTKEMRYYDDWLEDVFENTYDEFNRLISMTHIDNYYNSTIKEEYTYNAQGLIMEEIASYPLNGSWKPFDKWTYEYDEDENMTLAVRYVLYAGDEWSEYRKLTCEYENGLMQTTVFYHFEDEWQPESKNDFSYNTQGLCIEEIISEYIYEDWAFSEKTDTSTTNKACAPRGFSMTTMQTANGTATPEVCMNTTPKTTLFPWFIMVILPTRKRGQIPKNMSTPTMPTITAQVISDITTIPGIGILTTATA